MAKANPTVQEMRPEEMEATLAQLQVQMARANEMADDEELSDAQRAELLGGGDGGGDETLSEDLGDFNYDGAYEVVRLPLTHGARYKAELLGVKPGHSKKGRWQGVFTWRVFDCADPAEDGVTVDDYVPLPKAVMSPEERAGLGQFLRIADCLGFGVRNARGHCVDVKKGTTLKTLVGHTLEFICKVEEGEYNGQPTVNNRVQRYLEPSA